MLSILLQHESGDNEYNEQVYECIYMSQEMQPLFSTLVEYMYMKCRQMNTTYYGHFIYTCPNLMCM